VVSRDPETVTTDGEKYRHKEMTIKLKESVRFYLNKTTVEEKERGTEREKEKTKKNEANHITR